MDGADPKYITTMNLLGDDPHYVNTPAIRTGFITGPPPNDSYFKKLVAQARFSKLTYQRAVVAMYLIRPYSDYRAVIYEEYAEQFDISVEKMEYMELCLYERDGQLIMSQDYDAYAMYKQRELLHALCNIIGPYTKVWGLEPIGQAIDLIA